MTLLVNCSKTSHELIWVVTHTVFLEKQVMKVSELISAFYKIVSDDKGIDVQDTIRDIRNILKDTLSPTHTSAIQIDTFISISGKDNDYAIDRDKLINFLESGKCGAYHTNFPLMGGPKWDYYIKRTNFNQLTPQDLARVCWANQVLPTTYIKLETKPIQVIPSTKVDFNSSSVVPQVSTTLEIVKPMRSESVVTFDQNGDTQLVKWNAIANVFLDPMERGQDCRGKFWVMIRTNSKTQYRVKDVPLNFTDAQEVRNKVENLLFAISTPYTVA